MYRKEVNEQSPLRILEQSMHGGLGKGNLGVVMGRTGVGKTACLVQIGLDDLMRKKYVLHLSLRGHSVDHVKGWYDALFDDMAHVSDLADAERIKEQVARHRIIQAHAPRTLSVDMFRRDVELLTHHMKFSPEAVLVDGLDWEGDVGANRETLTAMKAWCAENGAELWMTARTHREDMISDPNEIPAPLSSYAGLIDVALLLQPKGDHVAVQLLKDHEHGGQELTDLELQPDTLRMVVKGKKLAASLPAQACTVLSGGAFGTEAFFGECAERWGIGEVNFTFEGRACERTRGVKVLTEAELRQGAVSWKYLETHMHRSYPRTEKVQRILESIWHQVNTAQEVFVVGHILDDGTVRGGMGWAAELAKHMGKGLLVFDQETNTWMAWDEDQWIAAPEPRIKTRRFTGTGTRHINDVGRAAIVALFERSFGAPR